MAKLTVISKRIILPCSVHRLLEYFKVKVIVSCHVLWTTMYTIHGALRDQGNMAPINLVGWVTMP